MNKTKTLRAFMLSITLMAAINLSGQTDGFFRNYDNGDRDGDTEGVTIGGMTNENPTPVGSGLLIMVAAGAGYALLKKKEEKR